MASRENAGESPAPATVGSVSPAMVPPKSTQSDDRLAESVADASAFALHKRKHHRGGKKNRRKSFAAVPPRNDGENGNGNDDTLKGAAQTVALRDDFYGINIRNLSNASIESETFFDHREQQPFVRVRHPSFATSIPHQTATHSLAEHSPTRLRTATVTSGLEVGKEDEEEGGYEEDDMHPSYPEDVPLLSQSLRQQPQQGGRSDNTRPTVTSTTRGVAFPEYGTNNAKSDGRSSPLRRRNSSRSGSISGFLTPLNTKNNERYNVNYPPSVPGSPPLRPTGRMDHNNLSFGDEMLRDELSGAQHRQDGRSPSPFPSPLQLPARGDRDTSAAGGGVSGGGGSTGNYKYESAPSIRHRPSVPEVEDDVCFPQERFSGIAEYDHESPEHGESADRFRTSRRHRGKWPDLTILDEWSRFEKEGRSEGRGAKKIKEPQLVNGRLRPVHRGWHRAEEDAPYRFTYFNEEFQSTIHSQSISELVQPGGSFRELFIPDPPLLSDSDDDDHDFTAPFNDDKTFNGGRTAAGLHGDKSEPIDDVPCSSRDSLEVAKELSNAENNILLDPHPQLPGTRSSAKESISTGTYPALLRTSIQEEPENKRQAPLCNLLPEIRSPESLGAAMVSPRSHALPPVALLSDAGPDHTEEPVYSQTTASCAAAGNGLRKNEAIERPKTKQARYGEQPVWWLDVLSPTEAEMKILSKAFGIHPLTAEDIIMQEAREKVELFRHYYFVSYRSFDQDPKSETFLEPVNMYVVVFRKGVLSFHFSMTPHPANVRRRIRQLSDYMILSSDWISYAIIDDITDVFVPLIQNIEDEVDDIDDAILQMHSSTTTRLGEDTYNRGFMGSPTMGQSSLSSRSEKYEDNKSRVQAGGGGNSAAMTAEADTSMLRRVGDCRKRVMSLYRLLGNKADVIKGFAKRCNEYWEVAPRSEIGLYLGDIQDHIVTMTSNLSHYEKILARSHGNYLAQINIRMNERQEQTADVLGKLTVLGTIVLPMNIITGLWGMNVWVPGQQADGDLRWFLAITAGLLLFGSACYLIAKRVYKIV